MNTDLLFANSDALAKHLKAIRASRKAHVDSNRTARPGRAVLSREERDQVLAKTNARCHVCGGLIEDRSWQADHVLALSSGGEHSFDNYLPAHALCNNYRWNYETEEFQWILKLGVWLRTQIEKQTSIGKTAGDQFTGHERRRALRRSATRPLHK